MFRKNVEISFLVGISEKGSQYILSTTIVVASSHRVKKTQKQTRLNQQYRQKCIKKT